MPGSASYTPSQQPLAVPAARVACHRYDRSAPAGQRLAALPNVQCLGVEWNDGPHPPTARFQYVFSDWDPNSPYPNQVGDVWPLDATGPYAIQNDDLIVVKATIDDGTDDGASAILFHGFATIPQADLTPGTQAATFAAVGVAVRCWDAPIAGRTVRHTDADTSMDPKDQVATDLPTGFNPARPGGGPLAIRPNCTPDGFDVNEGTATAYPVFYDQPAELVPDNRTYWTLGRMARYLLMTCNVPAKGAPDWIPNPDMTNLDAVLESYAPKQGQSSYDPNDPSTYDVTPILVRDFDATNMAWPDAIFQQIAPHGFSFHFGTEMDANGEPRNLIEFYRKDERIPFRPKTVMLQQEGATLDPAKSNVEALRLGRDQHVLANRYVIEARPVYYEVTIVLAPGFTPDAADAATATSRKPFLRTNLATATDVVRAKYRRYVASEDGGGFWDYASSSYLNTVLDLSSILGKPDADGKPAYARRPRPGRHTLISVDGSNRPYGAMLHFSRDYAGKSPAAWDGTGTWQPCRGEWTLLQDRLGISITCEDLDKWHVGRSTTIPAQEGSDALAAITSSAAPHAGAKRFYLRLTTVIEGDVMLSAVAAKRPSSPSRFAVTRRIECGDHFRKEVIAPFSQFNQKAAAITDGGTDAAPGKVRDDTAKALAHADAFRSAHESPPIVGTVTIPYLCLGYNVSDRISSVDGRSISLRSNVGSDQGEAPEYPWIESVAWDLADRQATTITLSSRVRDPLRM